MEEAEASFRWEWEKQEAERLQLSDWEHRLGDCIQVVASRAVEEWAQLTQEREALHEKVRRTFDQEVAVASRERAAARKEKEVELKERVARHTINTAKAMAKTIDDEQAALNHREQDLSLREAATKEEEARLSTLRTDLEAQRQRLEEESRSLSQWLEALKHQEAEVAEAPSSICAVLPTLDSAAERLQRLESTLVARLEAKGRELARMVVDHVLTCFWSHDPTISLTPVLEGPAPEVEAAAQVGVQEAVEIVAAHFERNVEPDL
ncbi:uncharacterized protein LOC112873071 [Panicum hallii]|uniref:uncharacterized protein LOC112873071 n=1 Tax=Panicum hallii TaxID=206008 RepID=UPI000DF4D11B|nr:uncharacterized protein LOC112873071 [Panicum hallii]